MSLTLLIGDLHYKKSNKDETDEFVKINPGIFRTKSEF